MTAAPTRAVGRRARPTKAKAINEAALWLIVNRARLRAEGRHTVPALSAAFMLSSKQAIVAIQLAHSMEARK